MSSRKTVPLEAKNLFGPKLKKMRLAKGFSIKEASAKLQMGGWDLSETALQHLEARRRAITDAELVTLLRLYKAKLGDLD